MLQQDERSNAVAGNNLLEPQDHLQQSSEESKAATEMVKSENQDGPERFAPWYPLLQKVRWDNSNQQHHGPFIAQVCPDQSKEGDAPDGLPTDSAKGLVNKLVPYHEYPAVQLRNGILTPQLSRPPRNLRWLQTRLLQARADSDWTLAAWQRYKAYPQFRQHRDLTRVAMRYLFKGFPEPSRYVKAYYQRWYDFPEYAPFAQGLEQPCPGFTQGFPFEVYKGIDIEYLDAAVCYQSGGQSLTLPHMAGEFAVGTLEAEEATNARHGAALVYMRKAALAHAKIKKDPEDAAVITTFISDGLFIRFYAHYESKSPGGRAEYHQVPILAANMAASYDEFRRGVAILRNCQDLAFVLATNLKNGLEQYHAVNGINAWAYHLDDGEHILSESEDSVIEGTSGQKEGISEDEAQQGKQHTSQSNDKGTNDSETSPKATAHRNEDESKSDASDTQKEKKEDDAQSPAPHQAQQTTRVLRPRKRVIQEEKKPKPNSRKRKARDAGIEAPKKRLRPER